MLKTILKALDEEIAALRRAQRILSGEGKISSIQASKPVAGRSQSQRRRRLSAKSRQAIAEAQRKRRAERKSQGNSAPVGTADKKEAGKG